MVNRMIVKIDEDKCNGCGKCVSPCAEGAIQIIDGKAKVVSEELCDGMGFCIGVCPQDAISIEERQTMDFNPQAVREMQETKEKDNEAGSINCFKCGKDENERYLMPLRHEKESIWVCTRCLPALIHG
ncbi:ATP-binding protein [Methanohalophilus halophilus]|uniref:4Fe-4S dicluster domain-containing protein n=1 Tax=Methanohalophilus halophilus TaxID=2177 RepID=A0A1L3Q1T0_9EURY|nr:4Fe-4S dicluster-binding protein [Methanohalophilus halophilus]APH38832.1 ferredoxin [Methanohalophilus halophilus]RNI08027.1 ferredoxin [Methanohalophilus halophilus]SDW70568.1 4Fe-4S dicluster domain-containing protein [Methanohalophilus halophilus]